MKKFYTLAFERFEKGDFVEAYRLSVDAIKLRKYSVDQTPFIKCELIRLYWLSLRGHSEIAFRQSIQLMNSSAYNADIQKFFLSLIDKNMNSRQPRLIFGLGTGRSGSTTLTHILKSIPNSYVSHEHPFLVPWRNGEEIINWHLARMDALGSHYKVVGDVAHWWLPYVEHILKLRPDAKFLAVKRDR